jgi:transcriptional regulator with XRE-family HTH domain
MDQIGSRIKHLRKREKMTQAELAKLAGIAQATVSEIESGDIQESSASIIFSIADALKTSARWITFGGYKVVE